MTKCFFAWSIVLAWCIAGAACAQSSGDLPQITAAQQLALEQLDQLIEADEAEAAVTLAVRMIDEADGRLVSTTQVLRLPQPPASIESFVPLERAIHDRLLQTATSHPQVLTHYRDSYDGIAQAALEDASAAGTVAAMERFLQRYFASSYGDDALLRLADLSLDRGWLLRARDALRRIDPFWQPHGSAPPDNRPVSAVDWQTLLARIDTDNLPALAAEMASRGGRPLGCYQSSDQSPASIAARMVYCHLLSGNRQTAEKLSELAAIRFPDQTVEIAGRFGRLAEQLSWLIEEAGPWPSGSQGFGVPRVSDWSTVGGHPQRTAEARPSVAAFQHSPHWMAEIPEMPLNVDQLMPGAMEASGLGPPALALPIVHDARVFLGTANGVAGWDLASGESWPVGADGLLYRAAVMPDDRDALRLPIDSLPRFTLSADRNYLAGRFGSFLTGRPAALLERSSGSQISLLDLQSEGALLDGYPLSPPDGGEFEGTPLIVGDRCFVGISWRDEATRQSRVVCYDLSSGETCWMSPPLSLLRQPPSQQIGHVSHALVSYSEGLVYFHSHQGTAAAVDAASGAVRWMIRYPRQELADSLFPTPRLAAGKRLSPVAICGGQAVILAADLDRVVVVDPIDGRLRWATTPGLGDDIDQVLGMADGRLIMAGRRLYWFEATSGRLRGVFPDAATRQLAGSMSQPRGAGKGAMTAEQIFWPTAEQILVFDSKLVDGPGGGQPRMIEQIDLRPWNIRGGHLAIAEGFLINAGPQRIAVFAGRLRPDPGSMKLTE